MFDRPRTSLGIVALLLLLPQTVYVIGDYMAVGVRFPFFRYQGSSLGPSLIPLNRELVYVLMGQVGGRTAVATGVWFAALGILILAAALVISWQFLENDEHAGYPGPLILVSGGLFLIWGMVQFGILFSGPSGYSIPVGVPLLWYCGYRFMQASKEEGE